MMTAKFRLGIAVFLAGLALASAPARAQEQPPQPANSTADDTVGPRELQDFNLQGTVTRRAEPQPSLPPPTPRAPASRPETGSAPVPPVRAPAAATPRRPPSPEVRTAERPSPGEPKAATPAPTAPPAVTVELPPVTDLPVDSPVRSRPPIPANGIPLPWLLASAALLAGAGIYLFRQRKRAALAGGVDLDSGDSAAVPVREPRPAPVPLVPTRPPVAPRPDPVGVVSTRLRPWLELSFHPTRCTIDDDNVTIEFELALLNSGSSPAREILVEASYFNAGSEHDQALRQFYANPVAVGERAMSLPPLKKMVIRNRIVTPRDQVREYEAGGRKLFVPLVGFNALYRWANGEGQTSAAFIVGRTTDDEKLAPFRLEMSGREFRTLGQRPLPETLRQ
ncbi:MAG: hypothetical protein ABIO68_02140 [Sphingomicrobium sp.]